MPEDIFRGFDFKLLDSPEFKEDSVREELLVPLLGHLGYSASGEHRIIRSKSLIHPYVYIGTKKHPVHIIPDYLLQFNGQNFWVLDAKAPSENINTGENVEQAFSYAIHKDVRVKLYALCNGKRFVLFHVSKWPPIFEGELAEISQWLPIIEMHLG
jgi:predicted type IV restriction endonuclease